MFRSLDVNDFILLFKLKRLIVPFSSFVLGYFLSVGSDFFSLLAGLLSMTFIYAAAATLNDIFDLKIDSISNPSRPLPQKKLAISGALSIAITLSAVGMGIAYFIALSADKFTFFALMGVELILGTLYAAFLSRNFVAANATLGLTHGVIPLLAGLVLFGGIISPSVPTLLLMLWVTLFLGYNIKDFKDFEGDMFSRSTLPSIFGLKRAKILVSWFLYFPLIASIVLKIPNANFIGLFVSISLSLTIIWLSTQLATSVDKKSFVQNLNIYRYLISLWIISLAL